MGRPERCAHRELLYDYVKFLIVRTNLDMNEVRRLYLEANLTASQIGEMFGVSKQMILSRLRRIGVRRTPDRGRSPDNFRYTNPPFGYRVLSGRLVLDRKEMKVVRRITQLRDCEKMKWSEIHQELNRSGFRTRRGCLWTVVAVKRVHGRWTGKV